MAQTGALARYWAGSRYEVIIQGLMLVDIKLGGILMA
jgi:hypothetical protein